MNCGVGLAIVEFDDCVLQPFVIVIFDMLRCFIFEMWVDGDRCPFRLLSMTLAGHGTCHNACVVVIVIGDAPWDVVMFTLHVGDRCDQGLLMRLCH